MAHCLGFSSVVAGDWCLVPCCWGFPFASYAPVLVQGLSVTEEEPDTVYLPFPFVNEGTDWRTYLMAACAIRVMYSLQTYHTNSMDKWFMVVLMTSWLWW